MIRTIGRVLRHSPAYATLVIGTVALATGIAAAVYSTVAAVRHPESPYENPEGLFVITASGDGAHGNQRPYDNLQRIGRSNAPLREVWLADWSRSLVVTPSKARERGIARIEPAFFRQFAKPPLAGRYLTSVDTVPGYDLTALISATLWRTEFGGDDIEDKLINVDGITYRVVGVTPDRADDLLSAAVWLPAGRQHFDQSQDFRLNQAIVSAVSGTDRALLEASLRRLASQLQEEHGAGRGAFHFTVREGTPALLPLSDLHRALMAGILALVVIATANLASLTHTRIARRSPLLAVQRALGASQARVLRDVLVESTGLALVGGTIGLSVFVVSIGTLRRMIPVHAPLIGDLRLQLDPSLFVFSLGLAFIVALAFALGPAIRASATQPGQLLRSASIAQSASAQPLQTGLVIVQISVALALLTSSVLVGRAARRAANATESSQLNGIVATSVTLRRQASDGADSSGNSHFEAVETAVRGSEGTTGATWWAAPRNSGFAVEGTSSAGDRRTLYRPTLRAVNWDYLSVMGTPIILGRDFLPGDGDGPLLAIVDERTAAELWPHESPLGRQLSAVSKGERAWATVIGVARAPLNRSDTFDAFVSARGATYIAGAGSASERNRVFVTRLAHPDDGRAMALLESRVRDVLPRDALSWIDVPADVPKRVQSAYRFISLLFMVFSAVAVSLAALGLYAILATSVEAASRERAIRLALGARPRELGASVARQGFTMTLAGTALGAFLAMLAASIVDPFLYDLYRIDALSLIAAETVIVLAGLLAIWQPARRAIKTSAENIARSA